jgi:Predicted metal-dependent hydrolase of the TIM-barrel fold
MRGGRDRSTLPALYSVENIELQQESFKLYNDWLYDWSSLDRKRLVGVLLISVYDVKGAIQEMHRCWDKGMRGALVWQVPDPALPFSNTEHYDPIFAACAEAGQPVICHILTGHGYMKTGHKRNVEGLKDSTNAKTNDSANTLFDFIFYGYFERMPKLKLLLAESEIGWMPFLLQQWDYYFARHGNSTHKPKLDRMCAVGGRIPVRHFILSRTNSVGSNPQNLQYWSRVPRDRGANPISLRQLVFTWGGMKNA